MNESRKTIDARGLPCPQPVILTKKAVEEGGVDIIEIIVDNEAARENVLRYASYAGLSAAVVSTEGTVSRIEARTAKNASAGGEGTAAVPSSAAVLGTADCSGATIFVSSDTIGRGNDELGALLMRGFTYAIAEAEAPPVRLILMNAGVRLAVLDSETLPNIKKLADRGVDIVACGTCLEFYGLKGKLAVGRVSNMYEIAELLQAGRIVSL